MGNALVQVIELPQGASSFPGVTLMKDMDINTVTVINTKQFFFFFASQVVS